MMSEKTNPRDEYILRFLESAASGDINTLNNFLKGTLNVNSVNEKGWTALMFAARNGNFQAAQALIESGCDTSIMNASGQTALDIALFWNHADVATLLTRKSQTSPDNATPTMSNQAMTHFFSGNPLDRAAHLRKDDKYLKEIMKLDSTRFVLFRDLSPYATQEPDYSEGKHANSFYLIRLSYSDLSVYLNTNPSPLVIFLGEETLANTEGKSAVFAVDCDGFSDEEVKKIRPHCELLTAFPAWLQLHSISSALVSQARPVLAWHQRYSFCPTCGAKTIVEEGGYKRTCTSKDCKSLQGVHNTSYPRVDPTVIMAVVSPDRKHVLLGRGQRHPRGMWSCLAGFMEPGESIEEACRREVKEESGIEVGRVDYHSCQYWPAPTSLMIGCIGYATSNVIKVDKDELEDARWFPRRELVQMLTRQHPDGLFCPPPQAIAHHLIKAWVNMTANL